MKWFLLLHLECFHFVYNIDVCNNPNPPCSWSNGVCLNTNGGYICSCNVGWVLGQDNASCIDVNECIGNVTSCSNGCITVDKQFRCPVYFVKNVSIPLTKGAIVANIPMLDAEHIVSFDVYPSSIAANIRSVVHFTIGSNNVEYGDRVPAVFINPNGAMTISYPLNGVLNYNFTSTPVLLNTWTNVRISQVLIGTQYVYTIRINNQAVSVEFNNQAQSFYNVTVYASDPWYEAQDGFIRNLFFINGRASNEEAVSCKHRKVSLNNDILCSESNFFPKLASFTDFKALKLWTTESKYGTLSCTSS
nr:uncharacterized protein LOC105844474 [Hydra vulgaris]